MSEAPALQDHHTTAVLAIFFSRSRLLHVRAIEIGKIDRIFFRKGATLGILFIVRTARIEGAVLSPLDDQGRSAALAFFVSRLLHALDVFHMLVRIAKVLFEFLVKAGERLRPAFLAFFDFVEFFF